MGVKTFQDKYISWSTRNLGSVHRTHICKAIRIYDFSISQKKPTAVPNTVPGVPLVQSANVRLPILGKGEYQAPQKRITPNILTSNMMPYSDRNNNAQRMPEYSV